MRFQPKHHHVRIAWGPPIARIVCVPLARHHLTVWPLRSPCSCLAALRSRAGSPPCCTSRRTRWHVPRVLAPATSRDIRQACASGAGRREHTGSATLSDLWGAQRYTSHAHQWRDRVGAASEPRRCESVNAISLAPLGLACGQPCGALHLAVVLCGGKEEEQFQPDQAHARIERGHLLCNSLTSIRSLSPSAR